MRDNLEDLRTVALYSILALALLAFGTVLAKDTAEPLSSPEVAVEEFSPAGESGGSVVPASCPSYAHTTGECTPPTFSCTSPTINEGESITCSWSCPSAYNTSSSGTNFSTGGALSGSKEVTPTADTTYTVTCAPTGAYTNAPVTVLHPTLSIAASPTRVKSGGSSTVTWSATQVTEGSCSVKKSDGSTFATGASGSQGTGALSAEETYTLTCSTEGGSQSVSVVVNLIPGLIEI